MKSERRYDIDWLRVIAIGLLLFYHIGIIFQPWAMFVGFIRSNESMENLWKMMSMLNVWRIPFLFCVSGMGVYFAIRRRTWKDLLMERSKRILVPFLFGMVAIVPLHFLIFQEYYNLPYDYYAHPAHLWFLGNIFVYVLILTPLFFYLKARDNRWAKRSLEKIMANPIGPFSISILFVLEVVIVNPSIFEMYALTVHGFFLGLCAFLIGFLLVYSGQTFWQTVLKWRWLYLGLAFIMYLVRLVVFDLSVPNYLLAVESSVWILGMFGFGYRYLNKPSKVLSYLSKAAYPVYIIHMFVLYAGAMLFLPLDVPVGIKFISIVLFTGLVCFLIYEFLIRRIRFLKPLFGLKFNTQTEKSNKIRNLHALKTSD